MPLSVVKGGAAANMLVKGLGSDFMKETTEKTLVQVRFGCTVIAFINLCMGAGMGLGSDFMRERTEKTLVQVRNAWVLVAFLSRAGLRRGLHVELQLRTQRPPVQVRQLARLRLVAGCISSAFWVAEVRKAMHARSAAQLTAFCTPPLCLPRTSARLLVVIVCFPI